MNSFESVKQVLNWLLDYINRKHRGGFRVERNIKGIRVLGY